MKIAILGAGGMTGARLTAEALRRGHTVIGIARRPEAIQGDASRVERRQGDAFERDSVVAGLAGADAVITTVGKRDLLDKRVNLNTAAHDNVLAGMRQHGIKRLVAISSFGAALDFTRPGLRRNIFPLPAPSLLRRHASDGAASVGGGGRGNRGALAHALQHASPGQLRDRTRRQYSRRAYLVARRLSGVLSRLRGEARLPRADRVGGL